MPTFIEPPHPGRPKRNPVDTLFTRLWVCAVKVHSGLSAPHAIEQELEPHLIRQGGDGVKRSRKWQLYESGERVPQRQAGQANSLDLAEAKYPGTAAYFDAPMKTVLRREAVSIEWVDAALASLEPNVSALLFDPVPSVSGRRRSRAFDTACAERLVATASFDGLQAVILLMTKAQLIASPVLRDIAWRAYLGMQPSVAALPIVATVANDLFMTIDATFKRWLYLRPDQRQEVVFFTNALRDGTGCIDMEKLQRQEALLKFVIETILHQ